jgi:hypothetical protein
MDLQKYCYEAMASKQRKLQYSGVVVCSTVQFLSDEDISPQNQLTIRRVAEQLQDIVDADSKDVFCAIRRLVSIMEPLTRAAFLELFTKKIKVLENSNYFMHKLLKDFIDVVHAVDDAVIASCLHPLINFALGQVQDKDRQSAVVENFLDVAFRVSFRLHEVHMNVEQFYWIQRLMQDKKSVFYYKSLRLFLLNDMMGLVALSNFETDSLDQYLANVVLIIENMDDYDSSEPLYLAAIRSLTAVFQTIIMPNAKQIDMFKKNWLTRVRHAVEGTFDYFFDEDSEDDPETVLGENLALFVEMCRVYPHDMLQTYISSCSGVLDELVMSENVEVFDTMVHLVLAQEEFERIYVPSVELQVRMPNSLQVIYKRLKLLGQFY